MGKCKEALEQAGGDMNKAIDSLRKTGMASAIKKEGRETNDDGGVRDVGVAKTEGETELVDGEERSGPHLVHVGGEGDGTDEANPQEHTDGSAAANGVGIAPDADLSQRIGNQDIQEKAEDVGEDRIHAASLSVGDAFKSHPRFAEKDAEPDRTEEPIGDGGDDNGGVICAHGKSSGEWAESVLRGGLSQAECI